MKFTAIFISLLLVASNAFATVDVKASPSQVIQIEQQDNSTLTLEACYQLALKRMETVAITKEQIEEAKAQFFKATGTFIGSGDFISQEEFQDGSGPGGAGGQTNATTTFAAERRRTRQFTFEQPVFQGFKSLGAVTGAGALTNQKKNDWIRSKQTLFQDVSGTFYTIAGLKKDIEIIEGIRTLFQERINELNEREQIGRSRASEVVNAVSRLKALEADLAKSRGNLQVARALMEFLTGTTLDTTRFKEENLELDLDRDPNEYLAAADKRPDVIAAKHAVTVAWDAIIVAQSGLWPTFNLTTDQYQRREGFQSGINWDALVVFDVPLYRGGETLGAIKEAISKWKQAKLKHSQIQRQAVLEIKQAYEDWHSTYEQYKSFDEAVQSTTEDFKLQKQDYTRSLVSNLDVLDALERLNSNQRDANRVYYTMKQNYWKLRVAMGETL
ncbi:MAG: TolC family protein [Candidatus Omnitrophica bacterium]|nr:TolC family protein [Candidatus Omnitrophota bacterium]